MATVRPVICVDSGDCYLDKLPDHLENEKIEGSGASRIFHPNEYLIPINKMAGNLNKKAAIKRNPGSFLRNFKQNTQSLPNLDLQVGRGPSSFLQTASEYLVPISKAKNTKKKPKKIVGKGLRASRKRTKTSKNKRPKKTKAKKAKRKKK